MSIPDPNLLFRPHPQKRWLRRWLRWSAAAIVALLLALLLLLMWLVTTTTGLGTTVSVAQYLVGRSLNIEGVEGTIASRFKISRLHVETATQRIDVNDIAVDWRSLTLFSPRTLVDSVRIAQITLASKPSTELAKIPTRLTLPIAVDVRALNVERIRIVAWEAAPGLAPLTLAEVSDIHARVASDGRFHQISDLVMTTLLGRVSAGVVLDGASPFMIAASAKMNGKQDNKAYQISADASGTLDAIAVTATATGWNLAGDAQIKLTPFAPVPIERAAVNMGEINPAAFSAGAPTAALTIRTNLLSKLAATSSQTAAVAATDWELVGPVEISNRSPGAVDLGSIPVTSLRADAEWKNGELKLGNLVARDVSVGAGVGVGANITGSASIRNRVLSAQLTIKNLDPRTWVSTLKPTRLDGELTLVASETAQSIDARLQEPNNKIAPWRAELIATHQDGEVDVKAVKLLAGNASLSAKGHLSLTKNRAYSLSGGLADFDPSRFADVPRAKLNADFNASGELKPELSANIKFDLRDSNIIAKDGAHALTGRGDIQFGSSPIGSPHIARAEVMLDLAGNRFDASGAWGRAGDKLKFTLAAPSLDAMGFGLSGKIDATGELAGTLAAPSGEITANATSLAVSPGIKIDQLKFNAKLSDQVSGAFEGMLKIVGIKREASADKKAVAATLVEQVDASLSGSRTAHSLRVTAKVSDQQAVELGLTGALAQDLKWQGKLDRLTINSTVANLALASAAPLFMSREQIKLGLLELRAADATPAGTARIRLTETEWSPQGWRSQGDMKGLHMSGLHMNNLQSATLREAGNERGRDLNAKSAKAAAAKLTLGANWDVSAADKLNGSLRVFRESGDMLFIDFPGDMAIAPGLTELDIKLTAVQNKVAATVLVKGEKFGLLNGTGAFEVQRAGVMWQLARSSPVALDVSADMASISWLGPLIDPALQLTGKLRGELHLTGTPASPLAVGSVRGAGLNAAWPDEGFKLTDGEVAIDFNDTRATLSQFSFRADPSARPRDGRIDFSALKSLPGTLTGNGELKLSDGKGAFKFKADRLALIQRANRWLMVSGETTVNTASDAVSVTGKLGVDAGYFELASAAPPRLSDDVVVRGRVSPVEKAVRFSVDIDADLGNQLYFNGRGLNTRLAGSLSLRAQPKSPLRVLGSVSASSGTFDAYGQYLTIDRGILNFQGPIETAGLNVLALRKGLAVEAGVEITGTVAEPRVRLVSEPNVPDTEKLSWIVVGRGQDQAGSSDSALLLSAATAILGGSSDSLPRQIAQGLGFDQLTVSSGSLGGNQSSLPTTTAAGSTSSASASSSGSVSSQIVTLGKRLSANAYVSYEQSLTGASSVVKLTYNLSRRISVIGRAGTDNSIDLSYTFSFN